MTVSKKEGTRAVEALERVRKAGAIAKREATQRTGMILGTGLAGGLGWMEATGKATKVGPFHLALAGVPMAFASALGVKGKVGQQIEAAAGPLLGIVAYRLGKGDTVVGGEYDGVAGEYD